VHSLAYDYLYYGAKYVRNTFFIGRKERAAKK